MIKKKLTFRFDFKINPKTNTFILIIFSLELKYLKTKTIQTIQYFVL